MFFLRQAVSGSVSKITHKALQYIVGHFNITMTPNYSAHAAFALPLREKTQKVMRVYKNFSSYLKCRKSTGYSGM